MAKIGSSLFQESKNGAIKDIDTALKADTSICATCIYVGKSVQHLSLFIQYLWFDARAAAVTTVVAIICGYCWQNGIPFINLYDCFYLALIMCIEIKCHSIETVDVVR